MKPLCYAPFIGMYATSYNSYAPCCVSSIKTVKTELTPGEYWTGGMIQGIRKDLLNGVWPNSCNHCRLKELRGLESETALWDRLHNDVLVDINIKTGNHTGKPIFLDYRPSNVCNLKCRMCNPNQSSQIEKEVVANPHTAKWFSKIEDHVGNLDVFTEYAGTLSLKELKVLGGEPTIDNNTMLFLENIIKTHNKLPVLKITTNGTNLNKRFQNIMQSFDKVKINFSIDATGKTYEYIRTNANWPKVKENIENIFYQNLAVSHMFGVVLMPYNIFALTDLLDWFYELYNKGYVFGLFADSSNDRRTGLSAALPEDLNFAISNVEQWAIGKDKEFLNYDGFNQLLPTLKSVKFSHESFDLFKKYNRSIDSIRGTKLSMIDVRFKKYE